MMPEANQFLFEDLDLRARDPETELERRREGMLYRSNLADRGSTVPVTVLHTNCLVAR